MKINDFGGAPPWIGNLTYGDKNLSGAFRTAEASSSLYHPDTSAMGFTLPIPGS